jgi:hypothetical protein
MATKKILFLFCLVVLSKQSFAQNNAANIAAVATGVAAIGIAIASIEDMKERAELTAPQWILANHPEIKSFSLKTLDFNGKKLKDMSNTSIITFKIHEFTPQEDVVLDGKKQILLGLTSYGWIGEQGIDFNKVSWFLIDSTEWMQMMVAYSTVSAIDKNENTIKDALLNGIVVNRGIRVKGRTTVPFFKLEGDMYLVTDYSSEMKLVYNENSLGIFFKKTGDLCQLRRASVIDIHEFFFKKD